MIVALVLAVVVAVAAIVALVLSQRTLSATRTQLAIAEARAGRAEEAARAAGARAEALESAQQALTSTTEQQRQALATCEQRRSRAEGELERCAEDRIEAQAELAATRGSLAQAEAAAEAEARRARELETSVRTSEQLAAEHADALRRGDEERLALRRHLDQLRTAAPVPAAEPDGSHGTTTGVPGSGVVEPSWRLLLARIERQWASAVGAGPDERGVASGPPEEQLHQAVARDLERLREEVGLHTELDRTGSGSAVHPLLVLLTAGELAAIAAAQSERVAVELGSSLVVVADGWSGDPVAVDALRATVAGTGLGGVVAMTADGVRVVVGPDEGDGARSL